MAKKKGVSRYSKKTRQAAKKYGDLVGWKKLSSKRIKEFLQLVEEAKGYVNTTSIEQYAEETQKLYEVQVEKMKRAAKLWMGGRYPTRERMSQKLYEEFINEIKDFYHVNYVNADLALEYMVAEFPSLENEIEEEYEKIDISTGRNMLVEGEIGFTNSDIVDLYMRDGDFVTVTLVDVDGTVLYSGPDRTDFWDVFREIGGLGQYPVYNAWYMEDADGGIYVYVEITEYLTS